MIQKIAPVIVHTFKVMTLKNTMRDEYADYVIKELV